MLIFYLLIFQVILRKFCEYILNPKHTIYKNIFLLPCRKCSLSPCSAKRSFRFLPPSGEEFVISYISDRGLRFGQQWAWYRRNSLLLLVRLFHFSWWNQEYFIGHFITPQSKHLPPINLFDDVCIYSYKCVKKGVHKYFKNCFYW